jgi:endonuclease YncB( thermonuclease family)
LHKARVIDGDTIQDLGTGVRYRLANIDAPETGAQARCAIERIAGECAGRVAHNMVRSAKRVEVRRTFRHDRFGRRVAFVLVDGADLGELLMARGLARPWRGRRVRWCGARGGFAQMAKNVQGAPSCRSCGAKRPWL